NYFERLLMQLTRHELDGHAEFKKDGVFRLTSQPFPELGDKIQLGLYELPRRSGGAHLYRFNHPLAEAIVAKAKARLLPPAEIYLDYGLHDGKVSILEPFIGQSGWLIAWVYTVESLDQAEDHLILAAKTDNGRFMDNETAARMLSLPGNFIGTISGGQTNGALGAILQERQSAIQKEISERNARFFEAEADKLDGWADDLKIGLEREIKELDRQIKEARRAAVPALTLEEKLSGQKQIKALEAQRNQKRRSLFDAQDEVDRQREELIARIEGKLQQQTELVRLFEIRWSIKRGYTGGYK
ncbi:MAG: DEAD/DEAH box helicase, partial [Desulfobacteraceae bacterium]